MTFDVETCNDQISTLCELIETIKAMDLIWPGYINDLVDVDREGCFV